MGYRCEGSSRWLEITKVELRKEVFQIFYQWYRGQGRLIKDFKVILLLGWKNQKPNLRICEVKG